MTIDIDDFLTILAGEIESYQVPVVDLVATQTNDPYRILVATILSARTKDEVTSKAAAKLFRKAPDMASLSRLSEEQLAKLIYPVGFYRTKAGYLARLPETINSLFSGVIPDEVEPLTKLPGVGRKTANLVVTVAFNKPAICVDTHVHRIMNIWGYVATKTPLETEMALREKLPHRHWRAVNSILVAFGQGTCRPSRPHCDRCVIKEFCPQIGVTPRKLPVSSKTSVNNTMKLISWNVNGLRAVEKKGFTDLVAAFDADILALQEIKAQPEQLSGELRNIEGYEAFWQPAERKGYAGVCVYSRIKPLNVLYGMGQEEFDREGRVLTLEFEDFFLVNCYFPNAQHGLKRLDYKLAFNRALLAFCNSLSSAKKQPNSSGKSIVICGDFNVAHKKIDLANPESNEQNPGFSAPERAWMDGFIEDGYIDSFRKFETGPGHYSWWSYRFNARARNIGWRIDYFCVDGGSADRVKGAAILKDILGSDHCPVSLDFK